MSNKIRHWKQQFDANANLVFRKRMTIRGYGVEIAQPGDLVPQAFRDHYGNNRLRVWWQAGYIEISEAEAPEPAPLVVEPSPEPEAPTVEEVVEEIAEEPVKEPTKIVHLGGGYYDVTRGGVTVRIQGKDNLPS